MLTEDYIMRMISQALAVIMTALGLKRSRKYKEALETFDQAVEGLLGLNASLVNQLDEGSLMRMLIVRERFDAERAKILADIYLEQSELHTLLNQPDDSQFMAKRSLRLYLEVFLVSEGDTQAELIQQIEMLRSKVAVTNLQVETRLAVQDYLDRMLSYDDDKLSGVKLSKTSLQADLELIEKLGI
ncbi:MAG: hypothetical protein C3F13_06550 [Anaerolineales bacterium]|nr:hypothetical protein [Anaerolineae bacterium]PWB54410.1 MAG: hypothetical protein C3F13_06550 [Anaerolineales bacterium]